MSLSSRPSSTVLSLISLETCAARAILNAPSCRVRRPRGLGLTVGGPEAGNREQRTTSSEQRTTDLKQQARNRKQQAQALEVSQVRKASTSAFLSLPSVPRAPRRSTVAVTMSTAYLDTSGAAAYLGLSKNCLEKWRCADRGPPYIRLGLKKVRYDPNDLDAWREGRRRTPRPFDGEARP